MILNAQILWKGQCCRCIKFYVINGKEFTREIRMLLFHDCRLKP